MTKGVGCVYQALYRKYRPQTFSDVVGQKGVTDTLRAQLETGKLSHAYLFTGTRGTGKTSCAKILAKAVNCLDPQDGNPCNCCAACRAIDDGSCMDVLEIDAASNNGVDSVRILRDDAIYTPSEVKKRVYIIDEVHMLSIAAFNALLKIIEEPPEHLLFILATTELNKVPATILSRCQRFSFRRLRPEDIAGRLNFIAYQEGIQIEPAALRLLSRLADGALRDGVSLLDQCASACTGELTEELVCRTLGLAGAKRTAELLMAAAKQDTAAALSIFETLYAEGKDLGALFDELSALCRDLLVLKAAPKSGISMLSGIADEAQAVELEKCLTPAELLRDLCTRTRLLRPWRTGPGGFEGRYAHSHGADAVCAGHYQKSACAAAGSAEGKRVFRQTHAGAVRACRTDGRLGEGPDGRAYCARKRTQRYYDDQIKESLTWQKADTAAACPWAA